MNLKRWLVFVTVVVCVGLFSGLTVTAAEEESQLRMVVAFPTHIDPAVGNSYSCARALTLSRTLPRTGRSQATAWSGLSTCVPGSSSTMATS